MKVLGINGSPRKGWNIQTLVLKALEGAVEADAETELIDLYTRPLKGCLECYACKRKGIVDGQHNIRSVAGNRLPLYRMRSLPTELPTQCNTLRGREGHLPISTSRYLSIRYNQVK